MFYDFKSMVELVQVGDIVAVYNKDEQGLPFIVIEKMEHGFYSVEGFFDCARLNHSNMYLGKKFKVIGHQGLNLNRGKYKGITWTVTGNENIDKQMNQLGQKYSVFNKYAPEGLKDTFSENEEYNLHSENNEMIEKFLQHLLKGFEPDTFSYGLND